MLNILSKLAQKPSDKAIRITRGVFALLLLIVIILGWNTTQVEYGLPVWIKYILFVFPLIGLVRAILDPGVFRKKIWKWTIFGLGISMILISLFLIEDIHTEIIPPQNTAQSGSIDINSITATQNTGGSLTLSTDHWFGFFGFVLMIVGLLLNGKNITTKNERYGEIVKKIRV